MVGRTGHMQAIRDLNDRVKQLEEQMEELMEKFQAAQADISTLENKADAHCPHTRVSGDSCDDCGQFI